MKTINVPACTAHQYSFLLQAEFLSVFLLHLNLSIPQLVLASLPLGGTFTHVTSQPPKSNRHMQIAGS